MKLTISQKPQLVQRDWVVVDATDLPLGRLSSEIAKVLRGKTKPEFTPHVDCGDHVIVINADKVTLTGRNKSSQLLHHWHTGYPGGLKTVSAKAELEGRFPERVVQRAVKRMMPKTPLGRAMFKKLHVYASTEHPHEAQKPTALDLGAKIAKTNRK